jgi:hypothetical protein
MADITSLQHKYTELCKGPDEIAAMDTTPNTTALDPDLETQLIQQVLDFANTHGHRYPKTWDDLDLTGLPAPCHNTTIADINAKAKRKRKRDSTTHPAASGSTTTP